MKKLFMTLVCLMTMVASVNAQDYQKIRRVAYNYFKTKLIAPSQFILTDMAGNKIKSDKIKVKKLKQTTEYEKISCDEDSITYIVKCSYDLCYEVFIIGEAMNRMGGYERLSETIYVTKDYIAVGYQPCIRKDVGIERNEKYYKIIEEKNKREQIKQEQAIKEKIVYRKHLNEHLQPNSIVCYTTPEWDEKLMKYDNKKSIKIYSICDSCKHSIEVLPLDEIQEIKNYKQNEYEAKLKPIKEIHNEPLTYNRKRIYSKIYKK